MQLSLFYSPFCYFCHKVLNVLKPDGSAITLLNVNQGDNAAILQKGGGKTQVPCLRIEISQPQNAQSDISQEWNKDQAEPLVQWLYESDDIIAYLKAKALTSS